MERRRKTQRARYRGGAKILRTLAFCTLACAVVPPAFGQDAVRVFARYNVRVAHIETIGTLFNGTEEVGAGSGILIGDKFVLTNNHVIPREGNFQSLDIRVRFKSRDVNPVPVQSIHRDPVRDLALLELAQPTEQMVPPRCPMPVIMNHDDAPPGTKLVVLGFPLDRNLSITGGLVSNHSGENGRWQTDSVMLPGNSGGPAFDEKGALLGIAVGGIVNWTFGGQTIRVQGVNFIIPTAVIVASPLFAKVTELPDARRCWMTWASEISIASNTWPRPVSTGAGPRIESSITGRINEIVNSLSRQGRSLEILEPQSTTTIPRLPVPAPILELPERLDRSFTVTETKDDHPLPLAPHSFVYNKPFKAERGYKITSCDVQTASANRLDQLACVVDQDGSSATLRFRLRSGPQFDRWRGWWAGTVNLAQQRRP